MVKKQSYPVHLLKVPAEELATTMQRGSLKNYKSMAIREHDIDAALHFERALIIMKLNKKDL